MSDTILPVLLTESEAAALLRLSPATLNRLRWARSGPPFIKLPSGSIRYDQGEILTWVHSGSQA